MCRPNENTGGSQHFHVVISYRNYKGKMQIYKSHPFIDLATAKRWRKNFEHTWPREASIEYQRDEVSEVVADVAAEVSEAVVEAAAD